MSSKFFQSLLILLSVAVVGSGNAQSLPSNFFEATTPVRRPPGQTAGTSLDVDLLTLVRARLSTDLLNPNLVTGAAQTISGGSVTWQHSARGLVHADVQTGTDLGGLVPPIYATLVGVDLFAETYTNGNSLVFGRDLNLNGLGSLLSAAVDPLLDELLGTSVINEWKSTATMSLATPLTAGQYYSIQFAIDVADGLSVAALSHASFSLSSGGSVLHRAGGDELLDLVSLLTVGSTLNDGIAEFTFLALTDLSSLEMNFSAATVADVNLLGGVGENQNVMSFSSFSLTPVPEPGSAMMLLLGGALLLRRSRYRQI